MDDLYLIAEVQDTFGSDGSVVIKSFSDFPERFVELKSVTINFFGKVKDVEVEFVRTIDSKIIFKFRRFKSAEDVTFLIDKKLYIRKENLHILPENSFYLHDILNCEVFIGSSFFGLLIDILKLPSNDLYVIRKDNGREVMIPAVDNFIDRYDENAKIIYLEEECKIFDEY